MKFFNLRCKKKVWNSLKKRFLLLFKKFQPYFFLEERKWKLFILKMQYKTLSVDIKLQISLISSISTYNHYDFYVNIDMKWRNGVFLFLSVVRLFLICLETTKKVLSTFLIWLFFHSIIYQVFLQKINGRFFDVKSPFLLPFTTKSNNHFCSVLHKTSDKAN